MCCFYYYITTTTTILVIIIPIFQSDDYESDDDSEPLSKKSKDELVTKCELLSSDNKKMRSELAYYKCKLLFYLVLRRTNIYS